MIAFVPQISYTHSILFWLRANTSKTEGIRPFCLIKYVEPGIVARRNVKFTFHCITLLLVFNIIAWLLLLLFRAGDIQPNPGPQSVASSSGSSFSSNLSTDVFSHLNLSNNLSFVQYNVQSVLNKLDVLQAELFEIDILSFTETWLSPDIATEDLMLRSYNTPERKDRPGDPHGGVMIYVKEGIHYKRRHDLELRGIESIWIELVHNHKSILYGLFYRPPNANAQYFLNIEDSVALAIDTGISDVIVTGDFNFNFFNSQSRRKIDSLCTQFSLYQSISQPTHYTEHSSSLIDVILISNKDNLLFSGVGDPFLNHEHRYHCPVFGILTFTKPKKKSFTRHIYNYDNDNFDLLRDKASSFDWDTLQDENIDIYASNIETKIISLSRECIPNKYIKIRPFEPPWLTALLKLKIRQRKRAYKKAKRTKFENHWSAFKILRNEATALIRSSKNQYFDGLAEKLKSKSLSPKDWWATLKSFITPTFSSNLPPLESNGHVVTDDYEKANAFNTFFQNQTILDDSNAILPELPPSSYNSQLNRITLTPLEVESILKTLKPGKASGPNGLSNRVLKELSNELSSPFCSLFNQSLHSGVFPASYKDAHVSPVPKKGDLSIISNHRPISLLNYEGKVFERLVFKHLFNHLQNNNILSSLQSGFIPGDSTVNQLAYLYHTFCEALDAGKEVRAVFCDISKAFDRVWHAGLIHKLEVAGVTEEALEWSRNYLSNRRQRVVLPGASSDWAYIRAGVPQGSILGPLLF